MDPVSACDVGCPAVSHACASADGQWLAVVTTKGGTASRRAAGVHVYNLDALKLHKSLPPPPGLASWPPVAAMALSAAGVLALAVRDNAIVMYDVEAGTLTPWSAAMATAKSVATAPPKLKTLPGQICGLSFDPTPGSQLLLAHTPSAIARVNLAVVPTFTPAPITKKRRRKGYRGDKGGFGAIEKQGGKTSGEEGGGDIKVVNLSDPCLFLGYFAPGQALMVERPWDDVLNAIEKPPYQRHLFGT
jgi:U3 small nucleolar RNA-associated protein 4